MSRGTGHLRVGTLPRDAIAKVAVAGALKLVAGRKLACLRHWEPLRQRVLEPQWVPAEPEAFPELEQSIQAAAAAAAACAPGALGLVPEVRVAQLPEALVLAGP